MPLRMREDKQLRVELSIHELRILLVEYYNIDVPPDATVGLRQRADGSVHSIQLMWTEVGKEESLKKNP